MLVKCRVVIASSASHFVTGRRGWRVSAVRERWGVREERAQGGRDRKRERHRLVRFAQHIDQLSSPRLIMLREKRMRHALLLPPHPPSAAKSTAFRTPRGKGIDCGGQKEYLARAARTAYAMHVVLGGERK
eukprot:1951175-Rhodomonas_salina.1